ncbi:hypothetical protein BDV29DRAFT_166461 [Aspergillus leporis]|uniref:Uncharacterized protein n=1 Tax=Aspergillus leporis TaxID=41062 RepID=A0A5N5XC03_9EURO|nr:hypothetical protein BDV29DRAFT_166461 [Aspergillus leporis]
MTRKFQVNVAKAISAQALLGLEYIHSCGIMRGGRYLIQIARNWLSTYEELYRHLGTPEKLLVTWLNSGLNGP